jgi:hypothetical protein
MLGIRQVSWVICGAIALGIGGVWVSAAANEVGEDRLDWRKILELPPPRGDDGNAFPRWVRAAELMPKLSIEEEILLFEQLAAKERPSDEVLAKAEAALAARKEALEAFVVRPGEFVEFQGLKSYFDPIGGGAELRSLARLKLARARLLIWRGHREDAARCIVEVIKIGADAGEDAASIIGWLSGVVAGSMGFVCSEQLLVQPGVDAGECATMSEAVAAIDGTVFEGLANALRGEFALQAKFVEGMSETNDADVLNLAVATLGLPREGGDSPPEVLGKLSHPLFDRKATVRILGRPVAAFIQEIQRDGVWRDRAFRDLVEPAQRAWRSELGAFWRYANTDDSIPLSDAHRTAVRAELERTDNPFGKLVAMTVSPAVDKVALPAYRFEARRRCLALLIEMRRRIALGQPLPESIEDLRPAGAPDHLLRDPFDGKLLRYDRERLRVWSIGPDGVDNGGEGDGNRGDSPDLVWSLPVELLKTAQADR